MRLPREYYRVEDGHDRVRFQRTLRHIGNHASSHVLRAFYDRNRGVWTTDERESIDRIGCVIGFGGLYYTLVQEMRSYRGQRADPARLTINAGSIAGHATRHLMVPANLLRAAMKETDRD